MTRKVDCNEPETASSKGRRKDKVESNSGHNFFNDHLLANTFSLFDFENTVKTFSSASLNPFFKISLPNFLYLNSYSHFTFYLCVDQFEANVAHKIATYPKFMLPFILQETVVIPTFAQRIPYNAMGVKGCILTTF